MTYDHAVKVNGKWYGAGDEVELTLPASVTAEDKKQVSTVEPDEVKVEQVKEEKPAQTKRSSNKRKAK